MEGWIKIHRKILKWEWYQDPNTFRLFFHLLLLANHERKKWKGKTIEAGQLITSYGHLGKDLRLGVQSIRTSLERLKSTGEVTTQTSNKYTLVEVKKWKSYQIETSSLTFNQQTTNKQLTTTKKDKKVKNEKNLPKGKSEDAQPLESMNQDVDHSFPRKRLYGSEQVNWFLDYWDYKMPNPYIENEKWSRIYVNHLKNKIGAGKLREVIEWASDPDCWWYSKLTGFKMLYYKREQILQRMQEVPKSNIIDLGPLPE